MTKKLNIKLTAYDRICADGCCGIYGTTVNINGKESDFDYMDYEETEMILKNILPMLNVEFEIESFNPKP